MPTIPSDEPHRLRQVAESFGTDAERYDRTRPRYPEELVARVVAASPGTDSQDGPAVLDVGCGTGISARQFQAAGCRVLGVDVDARMAAFAADSDVEVEVAAFEQWDPAGRTFDLVIAGQTWHWIDPLGGAVKAAEVLRPGGRLAVFWNIGDPEPEVADAFAEVYRKVLPDSPVGHQGRRPLDLYSPITAKTVEGIRAASVFGEPEEWRFDWQQPYTRDDWLDQLPTHGLHTQLPPDTLRELLDGVGAVIDATGGGFTMHYTALVITATLTPEPA